MRTDCRSFAMSGERPRLLLYLSIMTALSPPLVITRFWPVPLILIPLTLAVSIIGLWRSHR